MRWRKAGDGWARVASKQVEGNNRRRDGSWSKLVEEGDLVREQQAAPDYFWFRRWRPLFLVCRPAATSTLSSPGQKLTVAEFEARKKRRLGAPPKVKTRDGRTKIS